MNAFSNFFGPLLGLGFEAKDLTFIQISLRAIIVFLATLIMVRLGHKRSLARKSAFDAILLVILASFLARGINGTSPLFATIGAGFVIVLLNRFACVNRLLFSLVWHSHQRPTGNHRRKWESNSIYHAPEPHLYTRSPRGFATRRSARRHFQRSRRPRGTERRHQIHQKIGRRTWHIT